MPIQTSFYTKVSLWAIFFCPYLSGALHFTIYHIKRFSQSKVDFNFKYVYFPLQLQPEMTTSVLGKEYSDQLLAKERLSILIPDDWKIYVKEYPIQNFYMREKRFFQRLLLIPKVVLISKTVSTYDLIDKSQFVSTITGTVGWESISGGKNVLVFGLAWYRFLPGVFRYEDNPKIHEILSYKISHINLEYQYNLLMAKAYNGVIEPSLAQNIGKYSSEYTDERNNYDLYCAFKDVLKKL